MHQKIQKTKQSLLNALCSLMKKQPLKEITVAQLCRQAQINRTTFYKYYAVPMDVITEYVNELSAQIFSQTSKLKNLAPREQIYATIMASCQACLNNRQIMQMHVIFGNDFPDIIVKLLNAQRSHSLQNHSMIYFISGGVSALLTQWIIQDYPQSPEEVAALLTDYIIRLRGDNEPV